MSRMYAYNIIEFIGVVISLIGIVASTVFVDHPIVASAIISCLVVFLAVILARFSWGRHNRSYTLEVLSHENRGLAIRLLLTYSWLLHGEGKRINKFRHSKLHVSNAHYEYRSKRSNSSRHLFDMTAEFRFTISSCLFSRLFVKDFDIMVLQPKDTQIDAIEYSFDGGPAFYAKTSSLHVHDGDDESPKLLKATISFNGKKKVSLLTISYTMRGVDKIKKDELPKSIIACPFFYMKKTKSIDFAVEFPKDAGYRPKVVCLKKYPYDGKRFASEKLLDFEYENNYLRWTAHPKSHATQAIYVIEMHHPVEC